MGKVPILTNIFQLGWNHQLVRIFPPLFDQRIICKHPWKWTANYSGIRPKWRNSFLKWEITCSKSIHFWYLHRSESRWLPTPLHWFIMARYQQIATFWEWQAIYFPGGIYMDWRLRGCWFGKPLVWWIDSTSQRPCFECQTAEFLAQHERDKQICEYFGGFSDKNIIWYYVSRVWDTYLSKIVLVAQIINKKIWSS